jgi:hypothetical protein
MGERRRRIDKVLDPEFLADLPDCRSTSRAAGRPSSGESCTRSSTARSRPGARLKVGQA